MVQKTFHFLSGLPRSGSTVLASLLSQNPQVHVSPTSPLVGLMHGAKHMWDTAEHIKAYQAPKQIENVLGGMMQSFYAHVQKPVILDKNRAWANPENQGMLILALGRAPKIICTVRPVADVLASFIRLIRNNPQSVSFIDQELAALGEEKTDLNRCKLLMSEHGHVFQSWSVLKWGFEKYPRNMLFVEYDDLVAKPQEVLRRIYEFLELPAFVHDLQTITNPVPEDDERAYNLPGMHSVRPKLEKTAPNPREVLGEKIWGMYQGGEFWRK